MKGMRVLLVDDEVDFVNSLRKVLTRRGFIVDVADSAYSALSLIAKNPPDVVVLDVKMPGMDGIQALAEIKRIDPRTEVILLTGHFSPTDEEDTVKTGAFCYLLKPCNIMKLVDTIKAAGEARDHDY